MPDLPLIGQRAGLRQGSVGDNDSVFEHILHESLHRGPSRAMIGLASLQCTKDVAAVPHCAAIEGGMRAGLAQERATALPAMANSGIHTWPMFICQLGCQNLEIPMLKD